MTAETPAPSLVCPGCGSTDVSLERPFCGTCSAAVAEEAGGGQPDVSVLPAPGTTGSNTISRAELGAYFKRHGYGQPGDRAAAVFDDIAARREPALPVAAALDREADLTRDESEKPEVLGHPDDAAEEWLGETYENADDANVGYDRGEMIDAFHAGSDWTREQIAKFGRDADGRWRVLQVIDRDKGGSEEGAGHA